HPVARARGTGRELSRIGKAGEGVPREPAPALSAEACATKRRTALLTRQSRPKQNGMPAQNVLQWKNPRLPMQFVVVKSRRSRLSLVASRSTQSRHGSESDLKPSFSHPGP